MKIADGIEMLELKMNMMGRESIIYPTLLWDNDNVILIDAGLPFSLEEIKKAMEETGVLFDKLNKIIITHQDIDHIGGIKSILEELHDVEVLALEEEKPYIQGEVEFVRLKGFMERIKSFPEEEQDKVLYMLKNSTVKVNITLKDSQELPYSGGIIVIHTPGHTPGHICLYHKASKTLIAGDAMNIIDGQLTGPNKQILEEEEEAEEAINSLKKLEKYDIENVICYHGGLFNNKPNQRIKELE